MHFWCNVAVYVQNEDMAKYDRPESKQGRPKDIILYQYEVCPFCNKVRAFLDYHKVRLSFSLLYLHVL